MKTFQKPLSKEEESLCIQALQAEDAGRKSEAKRLLIERNLRLVAFDPQKNSRLAAYAARCIDNELLMMLRSKKKTSREVSLYEPIGTDREGNEINLLDVMEQKQPDIVEEMEKQRLNQKLYELMESVLSLREKEVLYLRYGLPGGTELTQKEVGKRLGISRSYVSRIEKRALLRLRDAAWG